MRIDTLRVSEQVRDALAEGTPVVALESTIFTHGLPRPRNVEVAMRGEEIVREGGGVPATIGVVHGQSVVGLSPEEINELAYDDDVTKASVRDLAYTAVSKKNAGTTIASTSHLARAAGIDVFATGGLGGVHHGASETFDESADIYSLARTPIVMVSSGAKAILDIAATLERFESLSIPVVGYRTNRYPGFYVVDSGFDLPTRVDEPAQVATMVEVQRTLGIDSAVLVANPDPGRRAARPRRTGRCARSRLGRPPRSRVSMARLRPRSCSTTSVRRPRVAASTQTSPSTTTMSASPSRSRRRWSVGDPHDRRDW